MRIQPITVAELILRLSECEPDAEVRIAAEPGWPLELHFLGVATLSEMHASNRCELHWHVDCARCAPQTEVVYLAAGDQIDMPYASAGAWEVAR